MCLLQNWNMSLDAESQEDELLVLASIYEESFTSVQAEAEAEVDGSSTTRGGVLAIHLDLPPDFALLSRLTKDTGKTGILKSINLMQAFLCKLWMPVQGVPAIRQG